MKITQTEEKPMSAEQRIKFCIEMAERLHQELTTMMMEWPDNRGQVKEAKECAEYIIDDLTGHKRDIADGREDFSTN